MISEVCDEYPSPKALRTWNGSYDVCIVDVDERAQFVLQEDADLTDVLLEAVDVGDATRFIELPKRFLPRFGSVDVLVANAGMQTGSSILVPDAWTRDAHGPK